MHASKLFDEEAREMARPRLTPRHVTVLVNAAIRQNGREGLCRIRNVSTEGLAIETSMKLVAGAAAHIILASGRETACIIRWVRDGRAGMSCAEDLTALLLEDRAEKLAPRPGPVLPRFGPATTASISLLGRSHHCGFDSISTSDVLLYGTPPIATHDRIGVTIHGLGTFPAVACIAQDGDLFARFTPPLAFRLLDEWLAAQD